MAALGEKNLHFRRSSSVGSGRKVELWADVAAEECNNGVANVNSMGAVQPSRLFSWFLLCLFLLFAAGSCGLETDQRPVVLGVAPAIATLDVGGTISLQATGRTANGSLLSQVPGVQWSSWSPAVATVDSTGMVRGVAPGTTYVFAVLPRPGLASLHAQTRVRVWDRTRPQRITVSPAEVALRPRERQQLTAYNVFADARVSAVTEPIRWESTASEVAAVGSDGVVEGRVPGTATLTATVGELQATVNVRVLNLELRSIVLDPRSQAIDPLGAGRISVTGVYADGSMASLLGRTGLQWTVTPAGFLEVLETADGVVLRPGECGTSGVVSVMFNGIRSNSASVSVRRDGGARLSLTPQQVRTRVGTTFSLRAERTDCRTRMDLLSSTVFTSNPAGLVAPVEGMHGTFRCMREGTGTINGTASMMATSQIFVRCLTSQIVAVELDALQTTLPVGTTREVSAQVRYVDQTIEPASERVTWSSSAPTIVSVDARGNLLAQQAGVAEITATFGTVRSAPLRVESRALALRSVTIEPPTMQTAVQSWAVLRAQATFEDGTTADVTEQAQWSHEGNDTAGTIARGILRPNVPNTFSVRATYGSMMGRAVVNASSAEAVSLEVLTGNGTTLSSNAFVDLRAVLTLSDGVSVDVTEHPSMQWSSEVPLFLVAMDPSRPWRFTAIGSGSASVVARWAPTTGRVVSRTTQLQVRESVFGGSLLRARMNARALVPGVAEQLEVYHYSVLGQPRLDISRLVTSSDPQVVRLFLHRDGTASLLPLRAGTVALQLGEDTLSEEPLVASEVPVRITGATLQRVRVDPASATFAASATRSFRALGEFSDGTVLDLTEIADWSTTLSPLVLQCGSVAGRRGLCTARANIGGEGSSAVQARVQLTPGAPVFFGSARVEASPTLALTKVLLRVGERPMPRVLHLAPNASIGLRAHAVWSDGMVTEVRDITNDDDVAWDVGPSTELFVSNARERRGVLTALSGGTGGTVSVRYRSMRSDRATVVIGGETCVVDRLRTSVRTGGLPSSPVDVDPLVRTVTLGSVRQIDTFATMYGAGCDPLEWELDLSSTPTLELLQTGREQDVWTLADRGPVLGSVHVARELLTGTPPVAETLSSNITWRATATNESFTFDAGACARSVRITLPQGNEMPLGTALPLGVEVTRANGTVLSSRQGTLPHDYVSVLLDSASARIVSSLEPSKHEPWNVGWLRSLSTGTATVRVVVSSEVCSGSAPAEATATVTVSAAMPTQLELRPREVSARPGGTVQARLIATYSNGNELDVTSVASWMVPSDPLSIDDLRRGIAVRTVRVARDAMNGAIATVRATFAGMSATGTIRISDAAPVLQTLQPFDVQCENSGRWPVGSEVTLGGFGGVGANTTVAPGLLEFTSSDPRVAAIDSNGLVQFLSPGTVVFRAALRATPMAAVSYGPVQVVAAELRSIQFDSVHMGARPRISLIRNVPAALRVLGDFEGFAPFACAVHRSFLETVETDPPRADVRFVEHTLIANSTASTAQFRATAVVRWDGGTRRLTSTIPAQVLPGCVQAVQLSTLAPEFSQYFPQVLSVAAELSSGFRADLSLPVSYEVTTDMPIELRPGRVPSELVLRVPYGGRDASMAVRAIVALPMESRCSAGISPVATTTTSMRRVYSLGWSVTCLVPDLNYTEGVHPASVNGIGGGVPGGIPTLCIPRWSQGREAVEIAPSLFRWTAGANATLLAPGSFIFQAERGLGAYSFSIGGLAFSSGTNVFPARNVSLAISPVTPTPQQAGVDVLPTNFRARYQVRMTASFGPNVTFLDSFDVSSVAEWSVSDETIARLLNGRGLNGVVTTNSRTGSVVVTARWNGLSATRTVRIEELTVPNGAAMRVGFRGPGTSASLLPSVSISSNSSRVEARATLAFCAAGTTCSNVWDVSELAEWSVAAPSIATLLQDTAVNVRGRATGATMVQAMYRGSSGAAMVSVSF